MHKLLKINIPIIVAVVVSIVTYVMYIILLQLLTTKPTLSYAMLAIIVFALGLVVVIFTTGYLVKTAKTRWD